MIGAVATVAALGLLCPAAGVAAKTETQPAEELIQVLLFHPRPHARPGSLEGTHVLNLYVYPLRGIAVVTTEVNDFEIANTEGVAYVERIPKAPFDGHLDLDFEGLGSFVGDLVATETTTDQRRKGCVGRPGDLEIGNLSGSVDFSGWDGYAGWNASSAEAFVERSFELRCHAGAAEHVRKPKTLTDYVESGSESPSNWRYGLRETQRRPDRFTELKVFGYELPHLRGISVDATTFERLAGGIVASRTVDRAVPLSDHLEVSGDASHPKRAILRPPAPFFGVGIYSRSTHHLTGSLAVQFPGLRFQLAGADTHAELIDEVG